MTAKIGERLGAPAHAPRAAPMRDRGRADGRRRPARARPAAAAVDRPRPDPRGHDDPRRAAQGRQELPRLPDRRRGRPSAASCSAAAIEPGERPVPRARGRQAARPGPAPRGPGAAARCPAAGSRSAGTRRAASARASRRTSLDWLDEHPDAVLVAIDTLGRASAPAATRGATPTRSTSRTSPGSRTSSATGRSALLIVHHARRTRPTTSWRRVSGTYGITGSADTIVVIRRKRLETFGTLVVTGRDVAEVEEPGPVRRDDLVGGAAVARRGDRSSGPRSTRSSRPRARSSRRRSPT